MDWIRIRMDPELLPGTGTRKIPSLIRIQNKSFWICNTALPILIVKVAATFSYIRHWLKGRIQLIPTPIQIFWIRIRPKKDWIRNLASNLDYLGYEAQQVEYWVGHLLAGSVECDQPASISPAGPGNPDH